MIKVSTGPVILYGPYMYVGRGSPLANPYTLDNKNIVFKVASLEEAQTKYRKWLDTQLKIGSKTIINEMNDLGEAALSGELVLKCYCHGEFCHAEVIKETLEKAIDSVAQKE